MGCSASAARPAQARFDKKDKGPTAQIDNSVFLVGTGVAVALSLLVVVATIATDGGL